MNDCKKCKNGCFGVTTANGSFPCDCPCHTPVQKEIKNWDEQAMSLSETHEIETPQTSSGERCIQCKEYRGRLKEGRCFLCRNPISTSTLIEKIEGMRKFVEQKTPIADEIEKIGYNTAVSDIIRELKEKSKYCDAKREENPVMEKNGFITRKENFPPSESWVENWEVEFDKIFKCNCILCQEKKHEFTTTAEYMKSFIKNTIIPAEVERGRIETRTRVHDWVKVMWDLDVFSKDDTKGNGWTGEDEVEASINSYLEGKHLK